MSDDDYRSDEAAGRYRDGSPFRGIVFAIVPALALWVLIIYFAIEIVSAVTR